MTIYKIPLVVDGVSFDDDDVVALIGRDLADLAWSTEGGQVLATLYVDENPVLEAVEAARRIKTTFPTACVERVSREIVGISDIAERAGVTPEAVRLWVAGKRGPGHFPAPAGFAGGGTRGPSKLWYWPDVNSWLANNYRLGDEYRYLSDRQYAQIVERLTRSALQKSIHVSLGLAFTTVQSAWPADFSELSKNAPGHTATARFKAHLDPDQLIDVNGR